ncbi:hypothetical protein D932_03449 [Enterococcus casseliflavus 14-MB-W-14]|nr:hypothetical protein D932_03449 [Enterococcus casseliflavus 14-MB-W-14]
MEVNKLMTEEFKEMKKQLGISSAQEKRLYNFFEETRATIASGGRVAAIAYEQKFYDIMNSVSKHHSEPEYFLFECAKERRYEDLYVHFYKGMAKHNQRIEQYGFS